MAIRLKIPLDQFERIFGKWTKPKTGRYILNPRTKQFQLIEEMSAEDYRAYIKRRDEQRSTRHTYIADVEPFMTGVTDDAVYIGGRRQMRDHMAAHGLVQYEEVKDMAPKRRLGADDPITSEERIRVREAMKLAMQTNTDYVEPADNRIVANDLSVD